MPVIEPEDSDNEPTPNTDNLRDAVDWDSLLDIQLEEEPVSVSDMDANTLLEKYHRLTRELSERGEILNPNTEIGREMHSERAACRIELAKRNML